MMGEINFYGIYIPWLVILGIVSILCTRLVSYVMARFGLYRFIWHAALFDLSVFIIILGGFTLLLPRQVF
jgi:hypothetical protein